MTRVGVCGCGTIGKRVAAAIRAQPDLELVGAAKRTGNYEAIAAFRDGIDLYAAGDRDRLERVEVEAAGDLDDLIAASDVMIDTTPAGVGAENRGLYEAHDTPAIFQGGESAEVAETSFSARANYETARDADYVRVVSCNTTGMSRLLAVLGEEWGVDSVRATMVRRGGDPPQSDRGPINDVLPDPIELPSHHAPDVERVFPDVSVMTFGIKVPATQMHVQCVHATLEDRADARSVRRALAAEPRIALLPGEYSIEGCGALKELARDLGRPRGDVPENAVWADAITVEGREVYLMQAIHQESIVVPENVDAVRAMATDVDAEESYRLTNETLDIGLGGEVESTVAAGVE